MEPVGLTRVSITEKTANLSASREADRDCYEGDCYRGAICI